MKEKNKPDSERQARIIFIIAAIIILALIIVCIKLILSTKFDYAGLEWKKIREGQIDFYRTEVPVFDSFGVVTGYVPLNLRSDPRKLQDINLSSGRIRFLKDSITYISVGPETELCEDNAITIVGLGALFLSRIGIRNKVASNNETHARDQGISFVDCDNSYFNTVILLNQGEENKINQKKENCYQITYKECQDMIRVTERFELAIVEQHMQDNT